MKKSVAGLLAAFATVAIANTAGAQICAGYPSSDRGFYFGARADFPDNGNSYGVEANYNFSGPLGVYGGLNVLSTDDAPAGADDSSDELFAGVAFEAASLGLMIGPRFSACGVAELRNVSEEGNSRTQIPLGIGVGASLGVPGIEASGYVQPQIVFSRAEFGGVEGDFENDFAVKAGVMGSLGLFTVGGEVRHFFIDGAEPTFGIRVGIAL